MRARGSVTGAAALALIYLELVSLDVRLAGVPLKVLLLAVTLGLWLASARSISNLRTFRFARPVLAVGVGAPAVWTVIALVTRRSGSTVATLPTRDILEEASRFGYLLLYFPLVELMRQRRSWAPLLLWPALLLAALTWVLWLVLRFGHPAWANTTEVLTFGGIFGTQDGITRVFFGNQVLFVPALAAVLAGFATGTSWRRALPAAALLLSAVYIAHARGLWLAVLVGLAPIVLVTARRTAFAVARAVVPFAIGLLVAAIVVVVVLLSVHDLPGFLSDTSAGQRVDQSSHLTHAWRHSPLVGSGLGASLADGFSRSPSAPWSFELTFLQLLFQTGALGVMLILWPLVAGSLVGIRRIAASHLTGEADGVPLEAVAAGVGALAGVYVASASNPFLLSSYGMSAVALGLALTSGPPSTQVMTPSVPRPPRKLVAIVILPVCAALAIHEFADRRVTGAPAVGAPRPIPPLPVRAVRSVQRAPRWATDGDLMHSPEPLYGITPRSGGVSVTADDVATGRRSRAMRARPGAPRGRSTYDITRWRRGAAAPDLVVVTDRGRRVVTRVLSLDGTSRLLASGTVTVRLAPPGTTRTFSVVRTAIGAGRRPDVVMIDRDRDGGAVAVTVIGGRRDFRAVVGRYAHSLETARAWEADAAAALPRTRRTSLLAGTVAVMFYAVDQAGHPFEIHPASEAAGFGAFSGERNARLAGRLRPGTQALTGLVGGHPVVYVVRPGTRSARVDVVSTGLPRR